MPPKGRTPIGLWSEIRPGERWSNEGVSRVVGFLIEGAASGAQYVFHIVVPHGMAATVRDDLRQLNATEGLDWQVWEPPTDAGAHYSGDDGRTEHERTASFVAEFANREVPVEAWVIMFPHFSGSLRLNKPKATLYPDALPYDFPLGWLAAGFWEEQGHWPKWRNTATRVMADSDAVITFSEHVARRHAGPLCKVPVDKIRVVPLAPPDLTPLLPFVRRRRRTDESRAAAADILRRYTDENAIGYLTGFPFEEIDFVAAATQDRPTKNLGLTADAVRNIVRDERRSLKLFVTAGLHFGERWTRLPAIVEEQQFHRDLISLQDLPRDVHAALMHCASLVVHSSFFEGIIGALPFYEAVSVGTPAVVARGPHIDELLETEPDLAAFVYDPYDTDGLSELILDVISNREQYVDAQVRIYERLASHDWAAVASAYAHAALGQSRHSQADDAPQAA